MLERIENEKLFILILVDVIVTLTRDELTLQEGSYRKNLVSAYIITRTSHQRKHF
jgi:hypothetical protein